MARISANGIGPSHADLAKETAALVKQGKLDSTQAKLLEWLNWKATG